MAGFFQQVLQGAGNEFFGNPYLKDYQHASKTFTTNAYANTPKFKWLFHVYFEINKTLLTDNQASVFPSDANHGILVKSIELPKFNIPLTELNQYNRKRYVQTKINYEPVRITFHDDNDDLIRHLWYTYYSYYYNDPSQPNQVASQGSTSQRDLVATALNKKNIYSSDISNDQNWGYLGEVSTTATAKSLSIAKAPFFKSISIFGFNQHNFSQYQLINPIIENFNHDTYNYYETTGIMENSMTVKYESVKYYSGALNGEKPGDIVNGFAEDGLYDKERSPIAKAGSTRSILGQGGLFDAVDGVVSDLANGNILGAIQTAGRSATTFKTGSNLVSAAKTELLAGVIGALSNPQTTRGLLNFPAVGATTGTGSQNANSTSPGNTTPIAISTSGNSPIK
jgi:hypothetical protein